ncbi:HAD-IA family hydrolase [Fictibacillus nanhaiensis]|uniref:HAD-IA family hydrolase n=1 Tax=Fictibacillus nanhaiensis TaxID=742169 RepID=A0ABS2ZPS7_9BACL|nr:HAD-IA family hydrolase [Fictibacillus nanhaiensis]
MLNKHIKGVIFDLWNTLVPLEDDLKEHAFNETAIALQLDPFTLKKPWTETRIQRETSDLYQYLHWLKEDRGFFWTNELIVKGMQARKNIHGSAFRVPEKGAVQVLKELKQLGIRIGVVSNCSSDVRDMISSSTIMPFIDVLALSAEIGIMKPEPQIYKYAMRELGLQSEECIYVGDGHDNELKGAQLAGLEAILLDKNNGVAWEGKAITKLSDIIMEVERLAISN